MRLRKDHKSAIDKNFYPGQSLIDKLELKSIPTTFWRERLPNFIQYWLGRNEKRSNWDITFEAHITGEWVKEQVKEQSYALPRDWQPSVNTMHILELKGVAPAEQERFTKAFMNSSQALTENSSDWDDVFLNFVDNALALLGTRLGQSLRVSADTEKLIQAKIATLIGIPADLYDKLKADFVEEFQNQRHLQWEKKFSNWALYKIDLWYPTSDKALPKSQTPSHKRQERQDGHNTDTARGTLIDLLRSRMGANRTKVGNNHE